MIGYSYHPAAVQEIVEAVRYYEERAPGLGKELRAELDDAVPSFAKSLSRRPESEEACVANLSGAFPFALIYAVEDSEIRIYAVSHRRRRPGYWLDRLPR